MGKKKSTPAWQTITHKETGVKMRVPMNRAARQAYKHETGGMALLPPILRPYTKPKPFGILDAEDVSDAAEKRKIKKSNRI